jgi:hypothetical protein
MIDDFISTYGYAKEGIKLRYLRNTATGKNGFALCARGNFFQQKDLDNLGFKNEDCMQVYPCDCLGGEDTFTTTYKGEYRVFFNDDSLQNKKLLKRYLAIKEKYDVDTLNNYDFSAANISRDTWITECKMAKLSAKESIPLIFIAMTDKDLCSAIISNGPKKFCQMCSEEIEYTAKYINNNKKVKEAFERAFLPESVKESKKDGILKNVVGRLTKSR